MAFSIRRMFSNITYFKKSEDTHENVSEFESSVGNVCEEPIMINYERSEPDSTSRQCTSLKLPESLKNYSIKKVSLSENDLLNMKLETKPREKRRKCRKLKVDIDKANQSSEILNNAENTPKNILLECRSSDFDERIKGFDFDKSFELYESDDHVSLFDDELESFSEHSDSESSKSPVKMCRKVDLSKSSLETDHASPSPMAFEDLEIDRNSEDRIKLFQNYMLKLEELEGYTKKLLNDFQFHIEVSQIFKTSSGESIESKNEGKISRNPSPNSWVMVTDREDLTKCKLKKQLSSIKNCIEDFVHENLNKRNSRSNSTYNYGHQRLSFKKKIKHYDFPDFRDALINLFHVENECSTNEEDICDCKCHRFSPDQSDSGLTTKSDQNMSITSSIGNFTLDSTTLSAYSESLDQIMSYNSFQDTSLYNTLLQKAAIERITFYVQVHSIQLKCEQGDDPQGRSNITFHCIPCKCVEYDENGLLRHILSQSHCEIIHFVYKKSYIKKCMASGKEIQPSTVLNPMTMYRDENKIVCFGDALYACSLCFENLIVGESVLMAHCADPIHVDRREKFFDIIG